MSGSAHAPIGGSIARIEPLTATSGRTADRVVLVVDGVARDIPMAEGATLDDVNEAIRRAHPNVDPARLPRAMTIEEAERLRAVAEWSVRMAFLAEITTYSDEDVRRALKAARRRGWALEGLRVEKLAEVVAHLRPDPDGA